MKTLANKKTLITLINIILILLIIKICKITGFCLTILNLISPLFFGYVFAWIIRPIIISLKKYNIKPLISTLIIYIFLIGTLALLLLTLIPKIINETKNILPGINMFIKSHPLLIKIKDIMLSSKILTNLIGNMNEPIKNIFSFVSTILYSLIISFFISANNIKISHKFVKYIPQKIINKISKSLRIYLRGTLLDMSILFVLTSILFLIIKLPAALIFAIFIAITNIIPYIGPYIGGIPAVLVGLSISIKLGIITLIIIVVLQILESSILQPYIMSKSLKLNPILIIIGLIIFSHFFGIIGMIISTPLVSIIKIIYDYYKKNKPTISWFKVLDK